MSKSLNNHIGILDSPNDMFGKCMSIPDTLIVRYFKLVTQRSNDDIATLSQRLESGENPRNLKLELGETIVSQFHSPELAKQAKENFINVFSKNALPDDIPEYKIDSGSIISVVSFICEQQLAPSKKEARRLIDQGAVTINEEKVTDYGIELSITEDTVIKVGKRKFLKLFAIKLNLI